MRAKKKGVLQELCTICGSHVPREQYVEHVAQCAEDYD